MRFTPEGTSAADLVNDLPEEELANLIYTLGEEPRSRRIARAIVEARPIDDAVELAEVVARASGYRRGRTHPSDANLSGVAHGHERRGSGISGAASSRQRRY